MMIAPRHEVCVHTHRGHCPLSLACRQIEMQLAGKAVGFFYYFYLFIFTEGIPLVHPLAELFPAVQSQT